MEISFDIFQTLATAVVALWVGELIKRYVPILVRFCIPAPVIGGILFALVSLLGYEMGWFVCSFNDTMRQLCMVLFFTTVGFQANLATLRQGGKPLLKLLALVAIIIVVQNLVAIGIADCLGLGPLVGMTGGSIPMTGGHGTAGAFGPVLQDLGVEGATTLTAAAATFGLVVGSLIGGPISERLINKRNLLATAPTEADEEVTIEVSHEHDTPYMTATFQLLIAAGLGTVASYALSLTGLTFPIYIGGMIVAAIMRNLSERTHLFKIPMAPMSDIGNISLALFLGIVMISLRLWELAQLALPLLLMLVGEVMLMLLFTYFVVFRVMGKDYDAAVITAGFCGFGLGATPNAMANMQAVCAKHRYSSKAFLLVPIIGAMFTDFINSLIIALFLNIV